MTVELRAPREVIGSTLADLADADPRVVVLDADLARSTRLDGFEARHPDRFFQMGVAEQNAIGVASGMAYAGLRPVFASMAMFSLGLPWTQLRQAAYAGLPITVIGTHPALDVGPDGGTHQMLEDLALARVLPEVTVLAPCDTPETRAAIRWAVDHDGVTYIRVARQPVRDLHTTGDGFAPGVAEVVADHGPRLLLVAEGSMVSVTADAADALAAAGIGARVVNIRSLKPLDTGLLTELADAAELVVTVENHSVLGGLGGAVAEVLGGRVRHERIGVPDQFGSSASADDLRQAFGLDAPSLVRRITALAR